MPRHHILTPLYNIDDVVDIEILDDPHVVFSENFNSRFNLEFQRFNLLSSKILGACLLTRLDYQYLTNNQVRFYNTVPTERVNILYKGLSCKPPVDFIPFDNSYSHIIFLEIEKYIATFENSPLDPQIRIVENGIPISLPNKIKFRSRFILLRKVNPGQGYTSPPSISLVGGGGIDAAATCTIDSQGRINSITITNPGSGYSSPPTVVVEPAPPGGTTAELYAVLGTGPNADKVVSIVYKYPDDIVDETYQTNNFYYLPIGEIEGVINNEPLKPPKFYIKQLGLLGQIGTIENFEWLETYRDDIIRLFGNFNNPKNSSLFEDINQNHIRVWSSPPNRADGGIKVVYDRGNSLPIKPVPVRLLDYNDYIEIERRIGGSDIGDELANKANLRIKNLFTESQGIRLNSGADPKDQIIEIKVLNPGIGYDPDNPPTIRADSPTGNNSTNPVFGTPTFRITFGELITSPNSGYLDSGIVDLAISGGIPLGNTSDEQNLNRAKFKVLIENGSIVKILSIVSSGSYQEFPSNPVEFLNSDFTTNQTPCRLNIYFGIESVPLLSGYQVDSIVLSTGSGYTQTPNIVIDPPTLGDPLIRKTAVLKAVLGSFSGIKSLVTRGFSVNFNSTIPISELPKPVAIKDSNYYGVWEFSSTGSAIPYIKLPLNNITGQFVVSFWIRQKAGSYENFTELLELSVNLTPSGSSSDYYTKVGFNEPSKIIETILDSSYPAFGWKRVSISFTKTSFASEAFLLFRVNVANAINKIYQVTGFQLERTDFGQPTTYQPTPEEVFDDLRSEIIDARKPFVFGVNNFQPFAKFGDRIDLLEDVLFNLRLDATNVSYDGSPVPQSQRINFNTVDKALDYLLGLFFYAPPTVSFSNIQWRYIHANDPDTTYTINQSNITVEAGTIITGLTFGYSYSSGTVPLVNLTFSSSRQPYTVSSGTIPNISNGIVTPNTNTNISGIGSGISIDFNDLPSNLSTFVPSTTISLFASHNGAYDGDTRTPKSASTSASVTLIWRRYAGKSNYRFDANNPPAQDDIKLLYINDQFGSWIDQTIRLNFSSPPDGLGSGFFVIAQATIYGRLRFETTAGISFTDFNEFTIPITNALGNTSNYYVYVFNPQYRGFFEIVAKRA